MHVFFFQAEDGIRDLTVTGVQDVCSSDLVSREPRPRRRFWLPGAPNLSTGNRLPFPAEQRPFRVRQRNCPFAGVGPPTHRSTAPEESIPVPDVPHPRAGCRRPRELQKSSRFLPGGWHTNRSSVDVLARETPPVPRSTPLDRRRPPPEPRTPVRGSPPSRPARRGSRSEERRVGKECRS